MKDAVYNEKLRTIIRYISILAAALLFILLIDQTKGLLNEMTAYKVICYIQNIVTLILFVILAILPSLIECVSIASLGYAIVILLYEPNNPMGILMIFLFACTLEFRGAFKKNTRLKFSLIACLVIASLLTQVRFGKDIFISSLETNTGYFIVIFLILKLKKFTTENQVISRTTKAEDKILNIAQFKDTSLRDAEWLSLVQQNVPYKEIAFKYEIKEGTVRNRLHHLYKNICVGDKVGFMNTYSDYKIIFSENETQP